MGRLAPVGVAAVFGTIGALALGGVSPAFAGTGALTAPSASAVAPDAPGSLSYFDLARKDCVGTARNTTSKVWFTVADGALSDTYWPTVDATNVHTLQYLVSDGSTFTDLQQRDMTYSVADDPTGMACTVTATDAAHGYKIITTYIADPTQNSVLMQVDVHRPQRRPPLPAARPARRRYRRRRDAERGRQLRACSPPPSGVSGPIPVAFNTNTTTNACNRSYAVPTYEALEASTGFSHGERRLRGDRQRRADDARLRRTRSPATTPLRTGTSPSPRELKVSFGRAGERSRSASARPSRARSDHRSGVGAQRLRSPGR